MTAVSVVIVDNGDGEGAARSVRASVGVDIDDVQIARPGEGSFATRVNRAIAACRHDHVLVVAGDVEVATDAVRQCVDALAAADMSCMGVAPKMQLRSRPGVLAGVGVAVAYDGGPYDLGGCQVDVGQFDEPRRVFGVRFDAALVLRVAFSLGRIGLLDTDFATDVAAVDWCWRANLLGYSFVSIPGAVVTTDRTTPVARRGGDRRRERDVARMVMKNMEPKHVASLSWARRGDLPFPAVLRRMWLGERRHASDADLIALGDPGPLYEQPDADPHTAALLLLAHAHQRLVEQQGSSRALEVANRAAALAARAERPAGLVRGELLPVLVDAPAAARAVVDEIDPPPPPPAANGRAATGRAERARPHRLRVVTLSPTFFGAGSVVGGGERFQENIAKAVAIAGGGDVDVELIVLGDEPGTVAVGDHVRRTIVRRDLRDPTHGHDGLGWGVWDVLAGADVAHVHQAFTRFGQSVVVAAGARGVPVILTDHGGPTLPASARNDLRMAADAVLAYSDFGALVAHGTHVVKGGVDTEWFTPPPMPPSRASFLYVGRLLPHKRIERAIECLPLGASLIICGQAPNPRYRATLSELARGRDVRFVEDADDATVRELFRDALAALLLSEHVDRYGQRYIAPELMGLAPLEAMACGTPAIVAATGALPEFVSDGETGFVVANDKQLRAVMQQLVDDRVAASAMGAAGRRSVEGRWDLPSVGAKVLDVYREVAAERVAR